ncbi:hypothetical protein BGP75_17340 [Motiliproteus sp. MSK22-1]|nr:hypothetical protein BGP75_17340 [Motiliproteus sp. MSK22-1]
MHNSTFDLALHPWHEPLHRISELAEAANGTQVLPMIGDQVTVDKPHSSPLWQTKMNPTNGPYNWRYIL